MDPALMTLLVKALHFINIFAAAVVAGGQIYVLLVVIPTKRRFPPDLSLQMHNAMLGHLTDRFKKPCGITSAITGIIILLLNQDLTPLSIAFMAVGLAGTLGVIICSRYFNVRTNQMLEKYSPESV